MNRKGQAASTGMDDFLSIALWVIFLVAGIFVIGLLVKRIFFS